MHMRQRLGRIALWGLLAAAGLLGSWGVYVMRQNGDVDAARMIAVVRRDDVEDVVTAQGTLQAFEQVNVGAQVTGEVKALHVALGDDVVKGQLIAEIDDSTQRNLLRQARAQEAAALAQLQAKESQLSQVQLAFERQAQMHKHGATTREAYEAAAGALAVIRAEIDALKAQLEEARVASDAASVNLRYTKIHSPMDGVIVAVVTQKGQTLNANMSAPVIVKVARVDKMRIRAAISEADVVRVSPGQEAFFTILGRPDQRRIAVLKGIELAPDSAQGDPSARSDADVSALSSAVYYSGLLETPNDDGTLRVGMTVQVRIVVRNEKAVLTIPSAALRQKDAQGRRSVAVVKADGNVQEQWIKVGMDNKTKAQVIDGLAEGDRVAVAIRTDAPQRGERGPGPH
jgi:macrolide-specific efflux system membrane fusion protein